MNVTPGVSVDDAVTSDLVGNVGSSYAVVVSFNLCSYAVDSRSERMLAASTNSLLPHPRRLQTLDDHEDEG